MGLSKKVSVEPTFKPKYVYQIAENFTDGILVSGTDITSVISINSNIQINLYLGNYSAGFTSPTTPMSKYIKGYSYGNIKTGAPTILKLNNVLFSGTWIFQDLYITNTKFICPATATLIFINCYIFYGGTEPYVFDMPSGSNLILINSTVDFNNQTIPKSKIANATIVNSSLQNIVFSQNNGSMLIEDGSFASFSDDNLTLNNYNITIVNSSINGFKHSGIINLNARNSNLGKTDLKSNGQLGIIGDISNCEIDSITITAQTSGTLRIRNSVINKTMSSDLIGAISFKDTTMNVLISNTTIINNLSNEYIAHLNNSNINFSITKSSFLSKYRRFLKEIGGTNSIRTVSCGGNIAPNDDGFNVGEITDTNYQYNLFDF